MERATLLIRCPDQKGIVAHVSDFVFKHEANIVKSDQYSTDIDSGEFFMRLEFDFEDQTTPSSKIEQGLMVLFRELDARWEIHYARTQMRMVIAVSECDHCLVDLLYRVRTRELPVVIPCVVSNHDTLRKLVEREGIPFHHLPVTKGAKLEQERQIIEILKDTSDFLVLARYMQILSDDFLGEYGRDIINIHHSFLPSFVGASPYLQAYRRGVKLIGATAHYVTTNLDEGPIIEQSVTRATHRDNVADLQRKGRTLEQCALATAIHAHVEHRIIRVDNKTIVFG